MEENNNNLNPDESSLDRQTNEQPESSQPENEENLKRL